MPQKTISVDSRAGWRAGQEDSTYLCVSMHSGQVKGRVPNTRAHINIHKNIVLLGLLQ